MAHRDFGWFLLAGLFVWRALRSCRSGTLYVCGTYESVVCVQCFAFRVGTIL